jgi:hypothetical protein
VVNAGIPNSGRNKGAGIDQEQFSTVLWVFVGDGIIVGLASISRAAKKDDGLSILRPSNPPSPSSAVLHN